MPVNNRPPRASTDRPDARTPWRVKSDRAATPPARPPSLTSNLTGSCRGQANGEKGRTSPQSTRSACATAVKRRLGWEGAAQNQHHVQPTGELVTSGRSDVTLARETRENVAARPRKSSVWGGEDGKARMRKLWAPRL